MYLSLQHFSNFMRKRMADGEALEGDHEGTTTSTPFSQLLFADDDVVSLDMGQSFYFNSTTSTEKPPKMLCFGSYKNEDELLITTTFDGDTKKSSTPQKSKATKSRVTCTATDSSSASSGNSGSTTVTTLSKSSRKRKGSGQEPEAIALRSSNVKTESPTSTGLTKVRRREKLGERVAALQHLVSPFGKTDTASVLHEAMGYIKFLQEQVQVLCSPYLQHQPKGGGNKEESAKDLRSRGLCLVPVAYTVHVASSNGSDFWSSSVGN